MILWYLLILLLIRDTNDTIIHPYKKHTGPVTGLSLHHGDNYKQIEPPVVLLSSSSDWTMNLWEENNPAYPILTFDSNDDYIYDCKFHTTNPSLFACVDGAITL